MFILHIRHTYHTHTYDKKNYSVATTKSGHLEMQSNYVLVIDRFLFEEKTHRKKNTIHTDFKTIPIATALG